ncbi:hypothetical protein AB1H96_00165 [Ligilactobacillus salivarius]|uniref:hypothetical protein n=1 Tax=Ligilactobacillus salivarius TaxID=1624 RepID=UPI00339CB1EB
MTFSIRDFIIISYREISYREKKKGMVKMILSEEQLKALRRAKGEMNITIIALAEEIGVSRFSLSRALKGQSIASTNAKVINNWLIKQLLDKQ